MTAEAGARVRGGGVGRSDVRDDGQMIESPVEKAGNRTNAVKLAKWEKEGGVCYRRKGTHARTESYLPTMFSQSFMQYNNKGALQFTLITAWRRRRQSVDFRF